MFKTDTVYATIVGGSSAAIAYLFGGVDHLIKALVIFMVMDLILGFMVSIIKGNTNSKAMFIGAFRKTAMGMMVIAAVQLDLATNSGNFMRNAMILFLIGMEGISMIENLGKMGIKVPAFLTNILVQLQVDNDDKKKGDK